MKPTKCLDISIENSASVWIFGSLLTNRDLSLTGRIILHKMVSSQVMWISRRLAYYLWYTFANPLIGFWNRLNPTFTMTVHFFRHSTSANGTTTPPKAGNEIRSMSWANCKIIDIFWRLEMPARDIIRSTSVSGSPQVTWNVFFTTTQGNDLRYTTSVLSITIPKSPTSERFKWTANLHASM